MAKLSLTSLIAMLAVFIQLCLSNNQSHAEQIQYRSMTAGISVAYIVWGHENVTFYTAGEGLIPEWESSTGLRDHVGVGARLGYNINKYFGLEVSGSWYPNSISSGGLLGESSAGDLSGNLVLNALWTKEIVLYFTGGYGFFSVPAKNDYNSLEGAFNIGGGIKVFIYPETDSAPNRLALRVDLRDYNAGLEGEAIDFSNLLSDSFNRLNILQITLGLELYVY